MLTRPETFTPSENYEDALHRASQTWGIEPDYWDIWGKQHFAPPDVEKTILSSLGIPAGSKETLDKAMEERLWSQWSSLVPPALVLSASDPTVPIHIPDSARNSTLEVELSWEDGSKKHLRLPLAELNEDGQAALRGRMFVRKRLALPENPPLGYHRIKAEVRNGSSLESSGEGRLILCPDRAWSPEILSGDGKAAGIAVSLYGLRSGRNWGCGDFTDLIHFTDWTAEHLQAGFIALNPLHAIPNRQPYNTSPYLPTSMFYRNPLYLDVSKIEDFERSRWARRLLQGERVQSAISELRDAKYVEYEKVYALKLRFLKLAFRAFLQEQGQNTPRAQEFNRYIETEGELLHRFAVYCSLDEIIHKRHPDIWIWPDWPEEYRDPQSEAVSSFVREHNRLVLFYKYIQWQVDLQLAAAQEHAKNRGLSIGLYHDLALATDRCGSDLWTYRPFYVSGCRVGSPPDDFSPDGQDWGFPPPNSLEHQEDGYRLFSASIRKNARHGGALRIDHVMRFFRLFWIPDGKSAAEGTYVKDYPDDLLRILALESVRNRFIVIGEDLGTVEPAFREALERFGILSYRLLYFEKNGSGGFKLPHEYPRKALVSVSTHDLPTLAGFWTGRDIEARKNAGLLDEASYQQQLAGRIAEKQKLLDVFFRLNLLPDWFARNAAEIAEFTGELHYAAVGFLASTPSELMVLNQEDLFKDTDQQNLPGSTEQYPNWRHKLHFTIEELSTVQEAKDCAAMFRHWMERTGRRQAPGQPNPTY